MSYRIGGLLRGFRRMVESRPHAQAVKHGQRGATYAELEHASQDIARILCKHGVRNGDVVAIALSPSIELVTAILGVLKSGAAYTALRGDVNDVELYFPAEQKQRIALYDRQHRAYLPSFITDAVQLHARSQRDASQAIPEILAGMGPAYVLHTSGSTGPPKAVVVGQESLANVIEWRRRNFPLREGETVAFSSAIQTDVAAGEILWPLTVGATVAVASEAVRTDPQKLLSWIRAEGIVYLETRPDELLRLLTTGGFLESVSSVKYFIVGGSILTRDTCNALVNTLSRRVWNVFGATETGIDATYWRCREVNAGWACEIGEPITG